ncbi:18627_t:CDS:2 [Gigaspora margarita]|uniref:18627_t:CDS:1 n=1 Tax=Gigaspora margarita TaxID=4874 RepID=A0ABN7V723_GIGMA|nr:18627_t:CDS:2 [Gigaspora margarita]
MTEKINYDVANEMATSDAASINTSTSSEYDPVKEIALQLGVEYIEYPDFEDVTTIKTGKNLLIKRAIWKEQSRRVALKYVFGVDTEEQHNKLENEIMRALQNLDDDYLLQLYGVSQAFIRAPRMISPDDSSFTYYNSSPETIPYVDPKIVNDETSLPNRHSDIYSIGVVLWEISNDKFPFKGQTRLTVEEMLKISREQTTHNIPEEYIKLLQDCWNNDPEIRPTIEQVCKQLKDLLRNDPDSQRKETQIDESGEEDFTFDESIPYQSRDIQENGHTNSQPSPPPVFNDLDIPRRYILFDVHSLTKSKLFANLSIIADLHNQLSIKDTNVIQKYFKLSNTISNKQRQQSLMLSQRCHVLTEERIIVILRVPEYPIRM